MASIVLKTFKGGNVTPQDDAIIYQTVIPGAGIFKGCEVTCARGNVLHISQGFGMIKGRFFEVYENEISVKLADTGSTLKGRVYIHLDLSNSDDPIQIKTETAETLSNLACDNNMNYNNSAYDLELAIFSVDSTSVRNLSQTFSSLQAGGGSGGGGGASLIRETAYNIGDTAASANAPGWCTLVCTQAGATASTEPSGYAQITKIGDKVLDGSCVFEARGIFKELDALESQYTELDKKVTDSVDDLSKSVSDLEEQMIGSDKLVQKIMNVSDYKKLSTYDKNTMYYCYDNADTQEIKFIYLGQHVIYATGINVTYQVDTDNAIKQVGALSNDIVTSAPTVTKVGYTFLGWKSDKNADKEILKNYVLNSESDVTLYAVFKKQISVTMDSGDAKLISGKTETTQKADLYYNNGVSLSDEVTMPQNVYEYDEDKSFCGWKTSLSSTTIYVPGEKYKFTKDEELVPAFIDTEYDFLSSNTYQTFHVPADGIYEFELWGGAGGDATGSITVNGTTQNETAKGGKGGHVKAYRKCKKDTYLYVYNGGKGNGTSCGQNGGAPGYNYNSSSYKNYGAGGGGATHVASTTQALSYTSSGSSNSYNQKDKILLIAGGGGGGGITGYTSSGTYNSQPYTAGSINVGGYGGGERGQDGSGGNLGGRQVAVGTNDSTNFGGANYPYSSPSYTVAGGGGGWFGGNYGVYGNSGAGGSSYVGNMPTFTHNGKKYRTLNEANINDGPGYAYIRYVEPCLVEA